MSVSKKTAVFACDVQTVWSIVLNVLAYTNWRSDLSRVDVLNDRQFVEYTKDGVATTFTITLREPYSRLMFEMENENLSGRWVGLFSQAKDQTTVSFTEYVTAKKWFIKPFVRFYLKKQQAQFMADLEKATLKKEGVT